MAETSIRRYEGTIGDKLGVTAILSTRVNDEGEKFRSGSYYYKKTGIPLSLEGQVLSDPSGILLRENEHVRGEDVVFSGEWSVKLDGKTITGTWTNPEKKSPLPISLEEAYPDGSARMNVHRFTSSWKREKDGQTAGENFSLEVVQLAGDSAGIAKVNTELLKIAWPVGDEDEPAKAPEITMAQLEKACQISPPAEIDWDSAHIGTFQFSMEVLMNEAGFFSMGKRAYSYLGGAHGEHSVRHSNFDLTTGKMLDLSELTVDGTTSRWTKLANARLRTDLGVKEGGSLKALGFMKDPVELNDNWFLTPGGIGFTYDPYEVAPYAQGTVRFILPWKDIAADLKPGTRVAELAAKYTGDGKK